MNSIASNSPIVREMIFKIICAGEIENSLDKHRINNEMVPTVSQKTHVLSRGFQESTLKIAPTLKTEKPIQQVPFKKPIAPLQVQTNHAPLEGYGRLTSLIRDGSISTIEYLGEGQPIKVTRLGKVQSTNIILSKEEVTSLLNYVSERTKIPVANKVFKVALDNILFNAVSLEELGTRFLIKKNFQISQDYSEAFK
ncbi:MAG: hypothetical protein WCI72_00050 [archaeon]